MRRAPCRSRPDFKYCRGISKSFTPRPGVKGGGGAWPQRSCRNGEMPRQISDFVYMLVLLRLRSYHFFFIVS
jgi:hypothetical protein